MKRFLLVLLLSPALAQVPVTPIVNPHVTFVSGAGLPCAGCKLQTFAAGTTTPLATYTSAAGTSVNTNPIILDAAGGANIWVGANSYKFILKDALGATIWSVDQVNAGNLFPCASANAIQIANGAGTGLTCDPTITINTTTHTINVGTLPTNHVNIGALGTPTLWNFDTASAATALASLGGGSMSSAALTVPSWLTVAGSPITTTGTFAVTPTAGLAANQFLATPNGATGPLAPRVIVPADLPVGTSAAFGAFKCDGTSITCPGGVLSTAGAAATCNANGCYLTLPGGTIVQWGAAGSCGTGTGCTTNVTFPTPFTSTTNLSITCTAIYVLGNTSCTTDSISITGFGANFVPFVIVGGAGVPLDGSQTAHWFAVGH